MEELIIMSQPIKVELLCGWGCDGGGFHSIIGQRSKKTKNVRDPNLGMKMSDFYISVNNSEIRLIFGMTIALKLLFIHLWAISSKLCIIFRKIISQMSING